MKISLRIVMVLAVALAAAGQIPLQPGCSMPAMSPNGRLDYMSGCVGNYANSPLPTVAGGVTAINVLEGGAGYSATPTVTIAAPGGAGVTARATAR